MKKSKELKELISEINEDNKKKHQIVKTGIKSLDYILGGGIELGSKIQIVAEASTGKSTLALQISKNFCKNKLNVLYVDTENSITSELLKSTGCIDYCDIDSEEIGEFVLLKESDFNTVNDKLDKCIKSKYFQLIIVDSLASMVSNCYIDNNSKGEIVSLTNNNTNFESRPLNLFINKYSNLANKYNIAILYVNQYRNKVDPKNGTILKEFGNKIVRYNSDMVIKIKKDKEGIWQDENGIFSNDKETNKNKLPTHAKLNFVLDKSNKMVTGTSVDTYIKYGYGIDEMLDDTIDKVRNNEIRKDGKYYTLPGELKQHEGLINLVNHIVAISKSSGLSVDDVASSPYGKMSIELIDNENVY